MTIKEKKYLSDIKRAIALIRTFTEETRSYTDYTNDLKTQSAVERQLAIIGEALNQIAGTYTIESYETDCRFPESDYSCL